MKNRKHFYGALAFLAAFPLWTAAVTRIDVQPIGPEGSRVGFAALNEAFHTLTGVHMALYALTDWLSLIPLGIVCGFAALGLAEWIRRRRLRQVDRDILLLGAFYVIVMAAFVFFELYPVNYRPVLIEGILEASYPSSTTLLVMTVMLTTILQCKTRIAHPVFRRTATSLCAVFTVFMVLGRLLSGVHWLSDIIGGILLSAGLVLLYAALIE